MKSKETTMEKELKEIGNIWGNQLSDELKSKINMVLVRHSNAKTIKRAWQNEKEMYKLVAQAIQATREETIEEVKKAFMEKYKGAGEVWFPYYDADDADDPHTEAQEVVEEEWQDIVDDLEAQKKEEDKKYVCPDCGKTHFLKDGEGHPPYCEECILSMTL